MTPVSHRNATWWSKIKRKSFKCFPSDIENILKERQRSENTDPLNSNKNSKTKDSEDQVVLTLASNKIYKFESVPIGYFRIRGGHTGNIGVVGHRVSIWDDQDNLIFSKGSTNDRIEIKDDLDKEVSIVTLSEVEENYNDDEEGLGDNQWSFSSSSASITIINGVEYSSSSSKRKHDGDKNNREPLQIVGYPNEKIILRGGDHRTAIVNGHGGHLTQAGKKSVTVFGNLQSATQSGAGRVKVDGDVEGTVTQSGMGGITVDGNVEGNVLQSGMGNVKIVGNVKGGAFQSGMGTIVIHGDIEKEGGASQSGMGSIKIVGNVWNSVKQSGMGEIEINGNVVGKISLPGAGNIEISGNVVGEISLPGAGAIGIGGNVVGEISSKGAGQVNIEGDVDGDIRCGGSKWEAYKWRKNF